MLLRGRSKISRRGCVDPFGGGCGPLMQHFLVKMFVKMKELGPVGRGRAPENFACRSANVAHLNPPHSKLATYGWITFLLDTYTPDL